jgi:Protein of unknown function (DUF2637)
MWSALPSNLRIVLGAALLLVIGVAVASFSLSFIALREVAANPVTGWGHSAWIFPLCVDAALLASEVVLVGASMVKRPNHVAVVPFVFMVAFGALTVWFNVERVPADWRLVTAVPPVAGIFMTVLMAYLLKMLAEVSGTVVKYIPPPPAEHHRIVRRGDTIHGEIVRNPTYGVDGDGRGRLGSSTTIQGPQNGQAKRRQIEAYLATLDDDELRVMTDSQLAEDMTSLGVPVSRTYAGSILGQWRTGQPAISSRRRNSGGRTRKR